MRLTLSKSQRDFVRNEMGGGPGDDPDYQELWQQMEQGTEIEGPSAILGLHYLAGGMVDRANNGGSPMDDEQKQMKGYGKRIMRKVVDAIESDRDYELVRQGWGWKIVERSKK